VIPELGQGQFWPRTSTISYSPRPVNVLWDFQIMTLRISPLKAGRPRLVQHLRRTYVASYNENTAQPQLRLAYRGAEIALSV
jgi:hypothetical protein